MQGAPSALSAWLLRKDSEAQSTNTTKTPNVRPPKIAASADEVSQPKPVRTASLGCPASQTLPLRCAQGCGSCAQGDTRGQPRPFPFAALRAAAHALRVTADGTWRGRRTKEERGN